MGLRLVLLAWASAVSTVAGAAANPVPPVGGPSVNGDFIARHYPPAARKAGEQGSVGFRVTVEPDGSLSTCDVTRASGFSSLDNATCDLIVRHARFQPVRDAEGRAVRAVRIGQIEWKLPPGTITASASTKRKAGNPDQIICKRSQAPGSWIIKARQCMTRAEWRRQERTVRDEVERVRDRVFCGDHGCS